LRVVGQTLELSYPVRGKRAHTQIATSVGTHTPHSVEARARRVSVRHKDSHRSEWTVCTRGRCARRRAVAPVRSSEATSRICNTTIEARRGRACRRGRCRRRSWRLGCACRCRRRRVCARVAKHATGGGNGRIGARHIWAKHVATTRWIGREQPQQYLILTKRRWRSCGPGGWRRGWSRSR
jgi:hypothetical protein